MTYRRMPPVLDMTLDGRVRRTRGAPLLAQVIAVAAVVAVLCTLLAVAALAIWVASMLVPVAIVAALVAWLAFKVRRWQFGRGPARATGLRWPPRQG